MLTLQYVLVLSHFQSFLFCFFYFISCVLINQPVLFVLPGHVKSIDKVAFGICSMTHHRPLAKVINSLSPTCHRWVIVMGPVFKVQDYCC